MSAKKTPDPTPKPLAAHTRRRPFPDGPRVSRWIEEAPPAEPEPDPEP